MTYRIAYWDSVSKTQKERDSTTAETAFRNAEEAQAVIDSEARSVIAAVEESKRTGILILGVMCSATKDDQMGLTAVGLDYSMTTAGGGTFSSTKFEFSNGNTLVITADNFATIYNLWVPFRRSFFTPGN